MYRRGLLLAILMLITVIMVLVYATQRGEITEKQPIIETEITECQESSTEAITEAITLPQKEDIEEVEETEIYEMYGKGTVQVRVLVEPPEPIDPYADYVFRSDIANGINAHNRYNEDIVGWIYVVGTGVDYPIVQGDDNEYYLTHSWSGGEAEFGAIMLDYRSMIGSDRCGNNTIIYGHNMGNGSMFAGLKGYMGKSFWEGHKLIEISTLEKQELYEVYACCDINGLENTDFCYWSEDYIQIESEEEMQRHFKSVKSHRYYNTGITPEYPTEILTLQTCRGFGGMRTVVFAHRVK